MDIVNTLIYANKKFTKAKGLREVDRKISKF